MERYICIHGHFYQPPRENPWLEAIELQDSAYPHHDWNERIAEECYAPNSASRILGSEGRILGITNNYAEISFNFGPTLLSWMEPNAPAVYQAILDADRESQKTFSGHGSALAQGYNHMILPLANRRDKYTQVLWAIWDFEHRFGRQPEGFWLPETAVDLETLEALAEFGMQFTILAPHQASQVRPIESEEWQDVSDDSIDSSKSYLLHLPSGRSIALFFYNGHISRAVAFERLLSSGESFANRLLEAFSDENSWPQLAHIAIDGETFGHHHRFGDMALAFALNYIKSNDLARLTNYGEYLEKYPPTHEVEIIENTCWSCPHGIERWQTDCGCSTGSRSGWNQAWRAPLREALDWLRDTLASKYEEEAGLFLKDPWAARDDYITVVLDRSPESVDRFLSEHAARDLSDARRIKVLKLMELQRHAMLMYTSCGWFFDDVSGIETVQVIQYAGRAVQLAEELFGEAFEPQFLKLLEQAKSNIPQHRDGRHIYEKSVKPAMVDLTKVGAHYAISSLFEEYGEQTGIFCYGIDLKDYQSFEAGRAKLAVGQFKVTSRITEESSNLSFGVLHFGDHNLNAGVRKYKGEEAYRDMVQEVAEVFSTAEFPEVIRLLDKHFGVSAYSLRYLFRDEQRKALDRILESTLAEIEASYRQSYELHYPLMRFLTDLGNPLPRALHAAAEFILNTDLSRRLSSDTLDLERVNGLLEEAKWWDIDLDTEGLGYQFKRTLEGLMERFVFNTEDLSLLQELVDAVGLTGSLPFEVNLWKVQNLYYQILWDSYPELQRRAKERDTSAEEWVTQFISLGEQLSIEVA